MSSFYWLLAANSTEPQKKPVIQIIRLLPVNELQPSMQERDTPQTTIFNYFR